MKVDKNSASLLKDIEVDKNETCTNMELLKAYKKNKDITIRNKIVENNLGLVYIAAKNKKKGYYSLSFEDLIQEGIIGMIKGIEKFNINRNTSFSTYICYWINHEINRAIINTGHIIRLPAHMYEKVSKVNQIENLIGYQCKDLDKKYICEKIKITKNEYNNIDFYRKNFNNITSLNTNFNLDNEESYGELQDLIPCPEPSIEETVLNDDLKNKLNDVLNNLPDRDREILELRYGLKDNTPTTLEEIGNRYGLTRERIRQIEVKSLAKIRRTKNGSALKDYLSYP